MGKQKQVSGLYDRVAPQADDGIGRVSVNWLRASYEARLARILEPPKGVGIAGVKTSLNEELAEAGLTPLRPEDEADIDAIDAVLVGASGVNAQLAYIGLIYYVCLGAELGQLSENKWRSDLGI